KRFAYSYDPAGNRLTEQIDDTVMGASYDALNRLLSQQPGGGLRVRGQVNEPASAAINGKSVTVDTNGWFDTTVRTTTGTNTLTGTATDGIGQQATRVSDGDQLGAS